MLHYVSLMRLAAFQGDSRETALGVNRKVPRSLHNIVDVNYMTVPDAAATLRATLASAYELLNRQASDGQKESQRSCERS